MPARQGGSLHSFARWLERQIENETDEAEAAVFSDDDDAVRLLTIHGSKGLAFPTTIVLDTGSCEQPKAAPIGILRGEHETTLVIRHVTEQGTLTTPLIRRAADDAQARARAERQRLSYVALTRARTHLAIILPTGKLRADSLAASVVNCAARLDEIEGVTRVSAHTLAQRSAVPRGCELDRAIAAARTPSATARHTRDHRCHRAVGLCDLCAALRAQSPVCDHRAAPGSGQGPAEP